MSAAASLEHEPFCGPAAGEDAPRVESYRLSRYDQTGQYVASQALVVRCTECGSQTVDGQQV